MGSRKFVGGLAAGAVSMAIVISGCGAAGPAAPSSLDPARVVPASSLLYASVTVRPEGAQRTDVEAALHKLFGARADKAIAQAANKIFKSAGTSYSGGVHKWLGQRVGLVITGVSSPAGSAGVSKNNLAVIAPTTDATDARAFIERALKRHPDEAGGIIGHYAVLGGRAAFEAIGAVAAGGQSLAASPAYQSDIAAVGAPEALVYVSLRQYASLISALPQGATLGPLLHKSLSAVSANAVVMGLTMTAHQISLDVDASGVKRSAGHGKPGSVAGLPASSWLAIATGGGAFSAAREKQFKQGFQLGLAGALSQAGAAGSGAAGLLGQRLGLIENDVLPALGPLSLSISGTSPLALAAGLQLIPGDPAAAARLLGMLRALAAKSPSLQVAGSATNFAVQLPTGTRLNASEQRGKVVVTYGFPDASAFLHPGSTLASNPVYQRAVAQLPAGSSVPVFFDFAPVASLVRLVGHPKPSTSRLLSELSYFIAGGHAGHVRLVLGLN